MLVRSAFFLFLLFASFSAFSQWTTSGTTIYNSNSGNVGIGTTSPRTNFEVSGYVSATTGLSVGASSFSSNVPLNGLTLKFEGNFGTFYIGSGQGFGYKFKTNTIDRLVIADDNTKLLNSNMLINTSTDNGNKLQVNGNLWTTGLILPTGAAAGKVLTSDASGNATWQTASGGTGSGWALTGNAAVNPATTFLGTTDNTPVVFRTGNTERARIDGTTGNLLIGKTSQSSTEFKIDVNGNVRATRMVVVATNGADFVFEPAYALPSLYEVETFIKQNHHLPGIAPATQMQKEGIDMGEHGTKLLQKIEELTLYVIDQDKRIAQEAARNKEQQAIIERQALLLEKQQKLLEEMEKRIKP